jgi:hypothetical protein
MSSNMSVVRHPWRQVQWDTTAEQLETPHSSSSSSSEEDER